METGDPILCFASRSRVLPDKMVALDHLAPPAQEASLETLVSLDPKDPLLVDTKRDFKNEHSEWTFSNSYFVYFRESLVSLETRDLLAPLD